MLTVVTGPPARGKSTCGRGVDVSRRPNVPCATCGTLLWGGRGALPPGERTCRTCRADPDRRAAVAANKLARNRGRYAARRAATPARLCACGDPTGSPRRPRCAGCAGAHRLAQWQRKNATRRGASPLGPTVSIRQLGVRDGWRCHICRRKVDPSLPYQNRMAGTRDHLVPVSEGGDDSPANLRLAHRSCNSRRGIRGAVQLALVG